MFGIYFHATLCLCSACIFTLDFWQCYCIVDIFLGTDKTYAPPPTPQLLQKIYRIHKHNKQQRICSYQDVSGKHRVSRFKCALQRHVLANAYTSVYTKQISLRVATSLNEIGWHLHTCLCIFVHITFCKYCSSYVWRAQSEKMV